MWMWAMLRRLHSWSHGLNGSSLGSHTHKRNHSTTAWPPVLLFLVRTGECMNKACGVEHEFGWTQEGLWLQVLGIYAHTLSHTPLLATLSQPSKTTDVPTEGSKNNLDIMRLVAALLTWLNKRQLCWVTYKRCLLQPTHVDSSAYGLWCGVGQ